MSISDFIKITKARFNAVTPVYFKKMRAWFKALAASSTALTLYADGHTAFLTALEKMHIYTICQYIIGFSISGILVSSLPVDNPEVLPVAVPSLPLDTIQIPIKSSQLPPIPPPNTPPPSPPTMGPEPPQSTPL